ncbi:MAG: HD domain-containing protein [Pyrinomonadaceae bacterium]
MSFEYPKEVLEIANLANEHGGRAMLVGGAVRDQLMGLIPKDFDLEIYGIPASKLRDLLERIGPLNAVGESFVVYKIGNHLDVSLPRRERKTGSGHKGFEVGSDPSMTFEEASSRRDFTINALMRDVLTDEIVDCHGGERDLLNRVLRMVSEKSFAEDSLRVLRAVQFAARFDLEIDPDTAAVCRSIPLDDLPKERIWGEIEKLLLKSLKPSKGIALMYALGIAQKLFPEIEMLKGVPQEEEWHPEGDVDVHTMLVVDEARKLIDDLPYPKKVTVMLGALCHDFGKPSTTLFEDGRIRSIGHDEAGVEPTVSFLDRLNIHTLEGYDVREQVIALVRHHLKPGMFFKASPPVGPGAFRRLSQKVESDLLYRVAKADSLGRNPPWVPVEKHFGSEAMEWYIERVRELDVAEAPPKRLLLGRHLIELGLDPSPRFSEILSAVYELQMDEAVTTTEEAIEAARKIISGAVGGD